MALLRLDLSVKVKLIKAYDIELAYVLCNTVIFYACYVFNKRMQHLQYKDFDGVRCSVILFFSWGAFTIFYYLFKDIPQTRGKKC